MSTQMKEVAFPRRPSYGEFFFLTPSAFAKKA